LSVYNNIKKVNNELYIESNIKKGNNGLYIESTKLTYYIENEGKFPFNVIKDKISLQEIIKSYYSMYQYDDKLEKFVLYNGEKIGLTINDHIDRFLNYVNFRIYLRENVIKFDDFRPYTLNDICKNLKDIYKNLKENYSALEENKQKFNIASRPKIHHSPTLSFFYLAIALLDNYKACVFFGASFLTFSSLIVAHSSI